CRRGGRARRRAPPRGPAGGRAADDLARPRRRHVELQGQSVDSAISPLVSLCARSLRSRAHRHWRRSPTRGRIVTRVLVTGSAGFIGGYVVEELLERGYEVVGVDNESKYGHVVRSFDSHPGYRLVHGDARDAELMAAALAGCDHLI